MFCYNQRPPRFSLVLVYIYIYVCMYVYVYIYIYHAFNPIFLLDLQLSKFLWHLGMVYCCGSHHPKYDPMCILWLNHDHQSSPMIQHSLSPNGPSFLVETNTRSNFRPSCRLRGEAEILPPQLTNLQKHLPRSQLLDGSDRIGCLVLLFLLYNFLFLVCTLW